MTIVELRQYTLHPGRRDELIELFEREFVESQESLGMRVIGTFRDLRDPDRFVWVRGFPDMVVRKAALASFYGGPVWREHGPAANATMIDSDDVHLLEPVSGEFPTGPRPAVGARRGPARVLGLIRPAGADPGADPVTDPAAAAFRAAAGAAAPVTLRTAPYVNDFPALPVHTEPAVVTFIRVPDAAALEAVRPVLDQADGTVLELEPTARSSWR